MVKKALPGTDIIVNCWTFSPDRGPNETDSGVSLGVYTSPATTCDSAFSVAKTAGGELEAVAELDKFFANGIPFYISVAGKRVRVELDENGGIKLI
jgi:hypothetical protein